MAVLKCKMCGGDMEITADKTFGTCEYCGSTMTLPKVSDDQRAAAFNRGNHFRRTGEFDKALAVYERIVAEDDADAEAHWCCALCRFGIEYVEDPTTYEWLPTCHRASFDSFLEDVDYKAAVEYSDGITQRQYQKDAAKIAEVQRGILATSQNEEPFDVFICYKESDENGERTRDSLMAQDIYYQLTEQGKRVFFARITLEDRVGTEYEPYIFAALNSAKVMVVVGTKAEYFNAVWVKNEWSRFLSMMKRDRSKLLLPCYKDMDPYDLPEALSVLQSYDMAKIGFVQDLLRGINKVLDADAPKPSAAPQTVVMQSGNTNVQALLQRGNDALEDEEWDSAGEFFNRVLDMDAGCAEAYLGLFLVDVQFSTLNELPEENEYWDNKHWVRAQKYAAGDMKVRLENAEQKHTDYLHREEEERQERLRREEEERIAEEKRREEARSRLAPFRAKIAEFGKLIAAGLGHTVGLRADGTVVAVGYNDDGRCDVSGWSDIVAVVAGFYHTVGLRADGTVVAVGDNDYGRCDVSGWSDIIAVTAGNFHTVGLRADGTVVAVCKNNWGKCDVSDWNDIVAIAAGRVHTVGLRADGTVVAVGENDYGQCDVSGWSNIVAVAAGDFHTVGLRADGTVVAVGWNDYGQCDVSGWSDIVAIAAGCYHTVGLRADGTVVAVGHNGDGRCDVSGWSDIVAVAVGVYHTVGLRADGTVIAVGYNGDGRCDVSDWKLFHDINNLEQERVEGRKAAEERRRAEEQAAKERRRTKLTAEKSALENELAALKGLFTGKHRKEIEARLAMIEKELSGLR